MGKQRLIDWIVFYAVSAIFQSYNGGVNKEKILWKYCYFHRQEKIIYGFLRHHTGMYNFLFPVRASLRLFF